MNSITRFVRGCGKLIKAQVLAACLADGADLGICVVALRYATLRPDHVVDFSDSQSIASGMIFCAPFRSELVSIAKTEVRFDGNCKSSEDGLVAELRCAITPEVESTANWLQAQPEDL